MPKSSKLAPPTVNWKKFRLKDPRVAMRAIIGVLLVVNLGAAIVAFKPFGGSADDLRKEQQQLSTQLHQLQKRLDASKDLVSKVEIARTQGDEFVNKYMLSLNTFAADMLQEVTKDQTDAGIRQLPSTLKLEPIEGSDTVQRLSVEIGYEGPYANLAKLINAVEKSPRFLILDSVSVNAPQTGQAATPNLNITLKVITYVRQEGVAQP